MINYNLNVFNYFFFKINKINLNKILSIYFTLKIIVILLLLNNMR